MNNNNNTHNDVLFSIAYNKQTNNVSVDITGDSYTLVEVVAQAMVHHKSILKLFLLSIDTYFEQIRVSEKQP